MPVQTLLRRLSPWIYVIGIVLLLVVELTGVIGKGAQRWLNLGIVRFQPSEIMKLAVPMLAAWYLHDRPLPPDWRAMLMLAVIIFLPAGLVAMQPDLGTAALIAASGALLALMAGLSLRIVVRTAAAGGRWRLRRLAFPARLPARACARPSSIRRPTRWAPAITSSRARSRSAPAAYSARAGCTAARHSCSSCPNAPPISSSPWWARNSGSSGSILLLALYLFIVARALWLAMQTNDTYSRLLGLCIALTFFVYVFINAGMVSGLLPVVGVPLPLVSYGGTSVVTLLAGFGILMGLYSHRKLVGS